MKQFVVLVTLLAGFLQNSVYALQFTDCGKYNKNINFENKWQKKKKEYWALYRISFNFANLIQLSLIKNYQWIRWS